MISPSKETLDWICEPDIEQSRVVKFTPAQIAHRIQFVLLTEVRPEHRLQVVDFVRAHFDQRGELIEVRTELEAAIRELEEEKVNA